MSLTGPDISLASETQEAIWLAPFAASLPGPFNLLWSLTFNGPLDSAGLQAALNRLVQRHDALRATFRWAGRRLERSTAAGLPVDLATDDVAPDAYDDVAARFGERPYDLTHGPLFRFHLLRLAANHHVLLCGFHHLVMDGTSWPVFVDEVLALMFGADLTELPPVPVAVAATDAVERYWRDIAAAAPEPWELTPDDMRAGSRTTDGAHMCLRLPHATAVRLGEAAQALRSTPFRLVMAALAAYLGRLMRREDVVVATTMTGRSDPALARHIGNYVNTAIVHPAIPVGATLGDVASQVHGQVEDAIAHQGHRLRVPPADRTRPRDPLLNPFTEVSFTRMPRAIRRTLGDVTVSDRRVFLSGVDRDVAVFMQAADDGYDLTWTWRPSRFSAETVTRWVAQFQHLLDQAVAAPDLPLDGFDLAGPDERRRILVDFNATGLDFANQKPLCRLVEDQVARTPDRIAVVSAARTWTYAEINAAANALADILRRRGTGHGAFVPLIMMPSVEMLIAELAVMKCGAAFVPLAPEWPVQRIRALIQRIDAGFVIVADAASLVLPDADSLNLSELDLTQDPGNAADGPGLDDAIYCIFTSGSTGEPKGAVNRHLGVVNRLLSMTETFGSAADDVVLVTSGSMADTLMWQFFWPLICGGRVVAAPRDQVIIPEPLATLLEQHAITVVDFVPSIFQPLVRHLASRRPDLPELRMVVIGGEAMNAPAVYEFKTLFPHVAVMNTYGPTETSIGALWYRAPETYTHPMPIGRPFHNIRAVVIDRHDRLTPVGMVGELCLGGACVGLGYLKDPATTRARFIDNPFAELGCDTLYRTGDLARVRPDGVIEFLGRLDDQIKIRGLRVEPGEIEAALMRHPAVAQAVVTATGTGGGDLRLHAYVVFRPDQPEPDAAALRESVRDLLPQIIIPSVFIRVPHLPVRISGKTDRRALAELGGEIMAQARPYAPPRTATEESLVAIWRDLLGEARIGIDDNFFFDLGGDSLKALLFVVQWEARTGQRIEVTQLFAAPTITALAAALTAAEPVPEVARRRLVDLLESQRSYVAIWKGERLSPDGFLFAQNWVGQDGGDTKHPLFWCCQGYHELSQLAAHLGPDQPVVGMRSGHLIMDYSDETVAALAGRYAAEIDRAQPHGTIVLGGNCQGGFIARAAALHLRQMGREITLLILMEDTAFKPYDGRVALLYGRDSDLNPFRGSDSHAADPTQVLQAAYPKGYGLDFIPGSHGQFFKAPNIAGLAAAVASHLRAVCPVTAAQLSAPMAMDQGDSICVVGQ